MANAPLFPVTVVGSWPRSTELVRALRRKEAGEITLDEFNAIADAEVLACIRAQEEAGVDIVSDGELRRDNFYSFAVDKLNGMQLMKVSELLDYSRDRARMEEMLRALDVPSFAIKSPIVVDRIGKRQGLALDELAFLREHTDRQIKIPLPGPYMLTRSSWFEGLSDRVYPTPEDLAADVVAILREEIIALRDQGCDFVQLDEPILSQVVFGEENTETFMCAALPNRRDPTDELEFAVRLMNETLEGIDGHKDWGPHLPRQLEPSGRRATHRQLRAHASLSRPNEHRPACAGVCHAPCRRDGRLQGIQQRDGKSASAWSIPRTDDIESPEEIVARVKELLQYFDPEKIYLNPDCGFGTFAERNVNTTEMAVKKMQVIAQAAELIRAEYR